MSEYRKMVIDHWIDAVRDDLSVAETTGDGHWEGECAERLAILKDYQALEAERDRYMKALEQIELMDPDWTLGVDENMSRLQSIAGRALKGGGDGDGEN